MTWHNGVIELHYIIFLGQSSLQVIVKIITVGDFKSVDFHFPYLFINYKNI